MDAWSELVELYEYKVADILSDREPRGGRRSIVSLRDLLLHTDLEPALMRRFRDADRQWRTRTVQGTTPVTSGPGAEVTPGDEELDNWSLSESPTADPEGVALARLAAMASRRKLDGELQGLAAKWRKEPGLVTLRAMYALSLNLKAGTLTHDVPTEGDPLVSLDDREVAATVLSSLADLILSHTSPTRPGLQWARSMMLQLADTPFPSERSSTAEPHVAADRNLERTRIREALGRGLETISRLLPPNAGGTGPEPLAVPAALYAKQAARRASRPDDSSNLLAVRLTDAGEVQWQGIGVGWQPNGREWQLLVSSAAYPLRRAESEVAEVRVPLDGREVRAYFDGEYLLCHVESVEQVSLGQLLALGRACAALLEPHEDYLHLRLARGVAQWLRDGRVDASSVSAASAAKYALAAPETLLALARKGAENLLARLARHPLQDVERAFIAAAEALHAPAERALRLLELLTDVQSGKALREVPQVNAADEVCIVAYGGEPVTVPVSGRHLTLRANYRGDVAAVLPGAPATTLADVWVFTLPGGGIVVARQGLRLGVTYQPALAS